MTAQALIPSPIPTPIQVPIPFPIPDPISVTAPVPMPAPMLAPFPIPIPVTAPMPEGWIMKTIGRTVMPWRRMQHGPLRPVEGNCFHQAQLPRSCGRRWQVGVEDEFHLPSRSRRRSGEGGEGGGSVIHPRGRSDAEGPGNRPASKEERKGVRPGVRQAAQVGRKGVPPGSPA